MIRLAGCSLCQHHLEITLRMASRVLGRQAAKFGLWPLTPMELEISQQDSEAAGIYKPAGMIWSW